MRSLVRTIAALGAAALAILLAGHEPSRATFPGANGMIVFSSGDPGEITVMNIDGSGRTILAADPEWDGTPAWSPDGQ